MRADFYLLTSAEPISRLLFSCRLLAKTYSLGQSVFVYCNTQEEAVSLDKLLWTFEDNSFIPHGCLNDLDLQKEAVTSLPPIQIAYHQQTPLECNAILLNLAQEIPSFYSQFQRILEIILNDDVSKELGRAHYRSYRLKEYELHTHNIVL